MLQLLEHTDEVRRSIAASMDPTRKSALGQFMTPAPVAEFMAEMFPQGKHSQCRLLDAGAGLGALTFAFLDRWTGKGLNFKRVEATVCEIDDTLRAHLEQSLKDYAQWHPLEFQVLAGDFIDLVTEGATSSDQGFTHAILNPPYKKIRSQSHHRQQLRRVGIETVNLYSAFVALVLSLLEPQGHMVAIIPRSFCNGPYYRPFRDYLLEHAAIHRIHLFESRNKTFSDDAVLQENVIIHLEKGGTQGDVCVSTSNDATFSDIETHTHPFERIVLPTRDGNFIQVPTCPEESILESPAIQSTLDDLGIKLSTGPVVGFRAKEYLREQPETGSAPLLYPMHFNGITVKWPIEGGRKPNAIMRNEETERSLYPVGHYCVVRRFTSKEEKRRIVACVIEPDTFNGAVKLGFENHLNVFHNDKNGIPEKLAFGLCVYLNTTAVDEGFRQFNGHTQVNATDLKQMRYPSRAALMKLGEWASQQKILEQHVIDNKLEQLIHEHTSAR
ncbi:class I SAM-dependent methyltransferase [Modicisalibacter sp. MOD 31.J]|uniref:Eco57I restriction-modification methylase domain-containing protein n=1 Tax=Modicisalibacter sp. MOD 31.J TaxID=2831897 RepID=UPI001CCBAFB7|nr:class I SAM-dependent methyltransferase [Modicisalibacter sp. MOD 31.J]MBZ9574637.1 Eco57I restriction-modification methylase domain-containing protein [Modicisalibacter sp. MOD 31.J]